MRKIYCFFALMLMANVAGFASSEGLPPFRVPDCLGVNIHFIQPYNNELEMIHQAGFGAVRMDFGWERGERTQGKYDFSGYQQLAGLLHDRGMMPLYILDYSNKLYEKEQSVQTEEGRQAFARFAAAAVKAIPGPVLWEIWNEPNIKQFWVQPDPVPYTLLAQAAAQAMRAADPNCTILAPACSEIKFDFLKGCFDHGLLNWIDAVSVHPYRTRNPESVMEEYQNLRTLIDGYPEGKGKPIVSGEWGYSVHKYGDLNVDEHMQAQFLVRQFLTNFLSDVRLSIWYDWHDDGTDPSEREHHFGTVKTDYTPKESYKAASVFMSTLRGMSLIKRIPAKQPSDYFVLFGDGSQQVLAAWTTEKMHPAELTELPLTGETVSMLGEKGSLQKENGTWVVPLSQDPLYLLLSK